MSESEQQTIYVVMGVTGEYSDRTEWPVCAFREEAAAQALVEKATRRAKEIEVEWGGRLHELTSWKGLSEHDPDFRMDYTGTYYFIYEVTLR